MIRHVRRLGHVQRDVLDTLRRLGPSTIVAVTADTGVTYGLASACLLRCLSRGLVERSGNAHTRTGAEPWVYAITATGTAELALRERVGHQPGVPGSAEADHLGAAFVDHRHRVLRALSAESRTRLDLGDLRVRLDDFRHYVGNILWDAGRCDCGVARRLIRKLLEVGFHVEEVVCVE